MNRFDGGVFLENIEWFDESGTELLHRLPQNGSGEIKFGAQLTVRESQAAVLFYKGKACDAFGPGRHTLKTFNLPILTKLLSIPWRGDSPLRAEVYMVNLKTFTNLKWGTRNPVAFRDQELGLIRLRAHGIFNIQVVQPVLFINSLTGTMGTFTTQDVESYLKRVIVSRLNDYLGEKLDTILNLPGQFDEFSSELLGRLQQDFAHFGLALTHLYITSITPPDEVQQAIDDQSRMNTIRDMDKFVQMKAAMAMEKAASSQGESAAGIGLGIGMMLPRMFSQTYEASPPVGQEKVEEMVNCPDCSHQIPAGARFCPLCGHQQLVLSQCGSCGKNLPPQARFCSRCGVPTADQAQNKICSVCQTENLSNAIFCDQCGTRFSG